MVGATDGRISAKCEEDALARTLQVRNAIDGIDDAPCSATHSQKSTTVVLVEPKGGSMSSERGSKKVKKVTRKGRKRDGLQKSVDRRRFEARKPTRGTYVCVFLFS